MAGVSLGSEFTLEGWINWDGTDGREIHTLANQGWDSSGSGNQWIFGVYTADGSDCAGDHESGSVFFNVLSGACAFSSGALVPGTWHHVAVTYDAGSATIWIDGVEDVAGDRAGSGSITNSEALEIGYSLNSGSDWAFNGMLDQIRLASTVFYTTDFSATSPLEVESDTVALWSFDEGSGTTAADDASGYDGTVSGAAWVEECPP